MTLRKKTLLITAITLLGLIVVSYVISSTILLRSFNSVEQQNTIRNINRALDAVRDNISTINNIVGDWAYWDDMSAFVKNADPEFVRTNFTDHPFMEYQLNLMVVVDVSGSIVFSKAFDRTINQEVPVPDGMRNYLSSGSLLLEHSDSQGSHMGVIVLPQGPMLIASRAILNSEAEGPVRGTLIMGRYLDDGQIEQLAERTHLNLAFRRIEGEPLPGDFSVAKRVLTRGNEFFTRPLNNDYIAGYSELRDIYGKPALLMRVDLPRDIYHQGQISLRYLMAWLLVAGIVFGAMTWLFLEKLVLSRLVRLSGEVGGIGTSGDLAARVTEKGNDEVSMVAEKINEMLGALETSRNGLQEALSRFEAVVDKTPLVAIQGFNREGTILYWNDASRDLYGLEAREVLGRRIQDAILNDDAIPEFENSVHEVWDTGEDDPPEEWVVRLANGESRTLLGTLFAVHQGDRVVEIFAMEVDITDRKKAEEKVESANRELEDVNAQLQEAIEHAQQLALAAQSANVAKSEFLARMSHEIRTPMNAVIGFTDMLIETSLTEEQTDYAHTIRRNGEALLALINDILDFSKIEARQMDLESIDFDPEVTAYDVCETIYPRVKHKEVEILCRIGNEVPAHVSGDPGRFRQVLINLMGNSAKFTDSGEIELSLDVEEEENDRLKLHITVRDTGIGIPETKFEDIFEVFQQVGSFTTRKYGGTGLGLAICRQLARLMGGDVWAEPGQSKGALFHFVGWFEKAEERVEKRFKRASLAGKKVLVADDNKTNLEIMKHILECAGMRCVGLRESTQVVSSLLQHVENGDPFDLCILDIQMPEVSGYQVAHQIRSMQYPLSRLPLLAFSSSTHYGAKMSQQAGFDGFLLKPARREKLLEMMENLLSKEKSESAVQQESIITQYTLLEEAKQSVRILLAEDNPASQKLARMMLSKAGYAVDVADNGRAAVDLYLGSPDRFDLIFMDVQMPEMDGLQATRAIREAGFVQVPIIAMTANAMEGDREECLNAGMSDYVAKPIRRDVVYEVIKKWILAKENL